MTWEIVLGIAELAAFVGIFVKWSASRAKTDTEMASALRELAGALNYFKERSTVEHEDMWKSIDRNTEEIHKHETWITKHDAREGREQEDLK
jgi:hypothetical protein